MRFFICFGGLLCGSGVCYVVQGFAMWFRGLSFGLGFILWFILFCSMILVIVFFNVLDDAIRHLIYDSQFLL